MQFIHSLSFRVLTGSFLLLLALAGLYSYAAITLHTDQMMEYVVLSAGRVSDLIKNSTHYSMLLNRKEDVYQIITTIGKEPGVEGIRIYNKRGEIMFSTNKEEEHTAVDLNAEACVACHEKEQALRSLPMSNRSRIYTSNGHRVLGLINPIRNEASCSNADCHAHPPERTVLGVLDVRMSLETVDAKIARSQAQMSIYAVFAVVLFAGASGLFVYLAVHKPVKRLIRGTKEISSGNLSYHIPLITKDEIGMLAESFNAMTGSLRKETEENERWSKELEARVNEKTEALKHIHDQMIQIEKMASLGKLSATVAHELNNPLEGILTYCKLMAKRLRKNDPDSEQSKRMLEELDLVIRETERCGNIVKNLLLFSRKQVGEIGLFPVKQIIDRAARLMKHHFEISNIKFETAYEDETLTLLGDEHQIQQALVALFVNAVEAMPGNGTLKIHVQKNVADDALLISITDSGTGIAQEDIPHIFEPFFTTKKDGKGVGLGLSVVYGIIERHGGTIRVSSSPGKGTTFTLVFPPRQSLPVKELSTTPLETHHE